MKELAYAMHFRGQASCAADGSTVLRTTSSGTSCRMETIVGPAGVEMTLHPAAGDLAFLEYELRLIGQDAFEGHGALTFGEEGKHAVQFNSAQQGRLVPGAAPGVMAGTVSWKVEGGSGRFASATGLITSTFTLDESGQLSEYHCGLLFIPE